MNFAGLSIPVLEQACGTDLHMCVAALRSQAVQTIDLTQQLQVGGCPDVFLGPEVGFAAVTTSLPNSVCRLELDLLNQTCANYAVQCISFLDLEESMGQAAAVIPQGPYFTATGWILLSADQSILLQSSEPELLFVSLLRNDLAISTGTSMNMVSVVLIESALASEAGKY